MHNTGWTKVKSVKSHVGVAAAAQVYYEGKKAIDYKADFFFYDMMWVSRQSANTPVGRTPPATHQLRALSFKPDA